MIRAVNVCEEGDLNTADIVINKKESYFTFQSIEHVIMIQRPDNIHQDF